MPCIEQKMKKKWITRECQAMTEQNLFFQRYIQNPLNFSGSRTTSRRDFKPKGLQAEN